jgi:hypothetical protein
MTRRGERPDREADLRAAMADIESRRVSLVEAYHSWAPRHRLVMVRVGKAYVLWVTLAVLAVELAGALALRSVLIVVIAFVTAGVVSLVADAMLDAWVDEHNARLDAPIKSLLADASYEDDA